MKYPNNKIIVVSLFALFGIFYVYNINGYDLWSPDEPRYAEVARESAVLDDYILPHLNGEIYYQKPPGFFWEIVLVSKIFSRPIDSFSARFPSVLSAVIILIIVYLFTCKYVSQGVALVSTLILGSTIEFWWLAIRAQIDMSLVLTTTLSGFLFFSGHKTIKRFNYKYLLAFFLMGIGTLIKGPVSLFPFISFLIFSICKDGFKYTGKLKVLRYFAVYFIVILLWLVPVLHKAGKNYYENTVIKQTLGRTVSSHSHSQPFYYYLKSFPSQTLPWSLIFISVLILGFKTKIYKENKFVYFNYIWFLSTFIIFSLISGKRELYLLQLYPSFAVLTAYYIFEFYEKHSRWITVPAGITGGIFAAAGIILPFLVKNKYPDFISDSRILGGIFLTAGIILLISSFKRKITLIVMTNVIFILCLGTYAKARLFPEIDKFKTARPIGEMIKKIGSNNIILFGDKSWTGGFMLYSGSLLNISKDINKIRNAFNNNLVLLIENQDLNRFKNELLPYETIFIAPLGDRKMVMIKKLQRSF